MLKKNIEERLNPKPSSVGGKAPPTPSPEGKVLGPHCTFISKPSTAVSSELGLSSRKAAISQVNRLRCQPPFLRLTDEGFVLGSISALNPDLLASSLFFHIRFAISFPYLFVSKSELFFAHHAHTIRPKQKDAGRLG